jgi:hypothetical protein
MVEKAARSLEKLTFSAYFWAPSIDPLRIDEIILTISFP